MAEANAVEAGGEAIETKDEWVPFNTFLIMNSEKHHIDLVRMRDPKMEVCWTILATKHLIQ